MKRFIEGADRGQSSLLPECLDDFIDESDPVRAVDAFVDALNLGRLGFDGVDPAATGRPQPTAMLAFRISVRSSPSAAHLCASGPSTSLHNLPTISRTLRSPNAARG